MVIPPVLADKLTQISPVKALDSLVQLNQNAPQTTDLTANGAPATPDHVAPHIIQPSRINPYSSVASVLDVAKGLLPDIGARGASIHSIYKEGTGGTAKVDSAMPEQLANALAEFRNITAQAMVPGVVVTTVSTASSSIKRVQQGQ